VHHGRAIKYSAKQPRRSQGRRGWWLYGVGAVVVAAALVMVAAGIVNNSSGKPVIGELPSITSKAAMAAHGIYPVTANAPLVPQAITQAAGAAVDKQEIARQLGDGVS